MRAGRGIMTAGGLARHVPVMLPDVLEAVAPRCGEIFVDGTFGGGGYTRALLESADCRVFAIDRDGDAVAAGARLVREFGSRLTLLEGRFSRLDDLAAGIGIEQADAVILDVGVSSTQIDRPERGFSFQADGPLDMRMGRSGRTAADIVNELGEDELARLISAYGEERHARAVAREIVRARAEAPIVTTEALARVAARAIGHQGGGYSRIHPATRTFQALRILVNDELRELVGALHAAERLLRPGGRLVVVTFHSLEDRIVKRFIASRSRQGGGPSRHLPEAPDQPAASLRLCGRSVRRPRAHEIETNPRARSAKLRVAERTGAPAWAPVSSREDFAALGVPDIGGIEEEWA